MCTSGLCERSVSVAEADIFLKGNEDIHVSCNLNIAQACISVIICTDLGGKKVMLGRYEVFRVQKCTVCVM